MDLLGLALALNLPLQGGRFSGDYSLDLHPTFRMDAPVGALGAAAMTFPGLVLTDPVEMERRRQQGMPRSEIMRHEMMHVEQQRALGPAFWPAYLLSGGEAFEPTYQRTLFPSQSAAWGRGERVEADYSRMWMPPDSMGRDHPLFRLASELNNGQRQTRLEFMPGYPRLLTIRPETERALLNLSKRGAASGGSRPPKPK